MKTALNHQKLLGYLRHNLIFILILLITLFLEINIYNNGFYTNYFHGLQEEHLKIEDGTFYGFNSINGDLISKHLDPNLTFT